VVDAEEADAKTPSITSQHGKVDHRGDEIDLKCKIVVDILGFADVANWIHQKS